MKLNKNWMWAGTFIDMAFALLCFVTNAHEGFMVFATSTCVLLTITTSLED